MEAAALREDSAGVRGDATDDQLPAWHFQPFDAARKHVSHIWTAPRRHLIRCQRRRWCRSLEKTHWFPNGCIVAKRRFSLWTVNDLIWAPDVAFRLAERSLREAEGGRGMEREREGWGNDRKERNSLAYDSQQQPRHLTALSWLCVCASLLFFPTCVSWQLNENQSASTSAILSVGERRWAFPVTLSSLAADQLRSLHHFYSSLFQSHPLLPLLSLGLLLTNQMLWRVIF